MSTNFKKSIGWAAVLMSLGVLAIYAGAVSLLVIIPAAALVWYEARPTLGSGRN